MTITPAVPRMLRMPAVCAAVGGISSSAVYRWAAAGLFPRPVALGSNCSVWPAEEVAAVVEARIAGADDTAIRTLVAQLHAARRPKN